MTTFRYKVIIIRTWQGSSGQSQNGAIRRRGRAETRRRLTNGCGANLSLFSAIKNDLISICQARVIQLSKKPVLPGFQSQANIVWKSRTSLVSLSLSCKTIEQYNSGSLLSLQSIYSRYLTSSRDHMSSMTKFNFPYRMSLTQTYNELNEMFTISLIGLVTLEVFTLLCSQLARL